MHHKDFDQWNRQKKALNHKEIQIFPKVRQIWFVKLGVNVGCEEDGKGEFLRPVIVLAIIGSLCWCVPLTTKHKNKSRFYLQISDKSSVLLSQARVLDKRRFVSWVGTVDKKQFQHIQSILKDMYFPNT